MIHLFKKVYLAPHRLFKTADRRIVLSPNFEQAKAFETGLLQKLTGVYLPPVLEAESFDQLVSNQYAGNETAFIKDLLELGEEKLVIYANLQDILVIYTKLLKTVYTQWKEEDFHAVINLFVLKLKSLSGLGSSTIGESEALPNHFQEELVSLTYWEALRRLWADHSTWQFNAVSREELLESLSLEFQLATVIKNPEWVSKNQAEKKITLSIRKFLIEQFVCEVKQPILDNLVNFHVFDPDSAFDVEKDSLEDLVSVHPEYQFLIDDQFTPSNVQHIDETYNWNDLRVIYNKVTQLTVKLKFLFTDLFQDDVTYHDLLLENSEQVFTQGRFADTVNPYLIGILTDPDHPEHLAFIERLDLSATF